MTEEKKEENQIERKEVRKFNYVGEQVSFEFEIDVSSPEVAVAEIADFIELMKQSSGDLEGLSKEFIKKIEKPTKEKKKPGPIGVSMDSAS